MVRRRLVRSVDNAACAVELMTAKLYHARNLLKMGGVQVGGQIYQKHRKLGYRCMYPLDDSAQEAKFAV